MHFRLRIYIFAVLTIVFSLAGSVDAHAAGDASIVNFRSEAVLSQSGSMQVTETIDYDFGSERQHGIYRDIPITYTDDDGNTYKPEISLIDVKQDDTKAIYSRSNKSRYIRIQIGDENKEISGNHRYTITYSFDRIIRNTDNGQILAFNVTGNDWDVAIDGSAADITFPDGINLSLGSTRCYTGESGSTETNCRVSQNGSTVSASSNDQLSTGEGLSVYVNAAAGSFTNVLEPYIAPPVLGAAYPLAALSVLLAIAGWLIYAVYSIKSYRRRHSRTVIAEYDAPSGMTPAEVGLLIDDVSGSPEITATLIDLAVRGHLQIELLKKKTLTRGATYRFIKKVATGELSDNETKLLDALFGSKNEVILPDGIQPDVMAKTVESIHSDVAIRLQTKGIYLVKPSAWRWVGPLLLLFLLSAMGVLAVFLALAATNLQALLLVLFMVILSSALLSLIVLWLRKPAGLTDEGVVTFAKLRGFKKYLEVAEKDRIDFSDAPDKTPERFNTLLPYAIALGVEKKWAQQFEGIDVAPATGWYAGHDQGTFTAIYLASTLGSDFNSTVSNSFTPPSTSSAGGGYSGGGFGGGGGGSW